MYNSPFYFKSFFPKALFGLIAFIIIISFESCVKRDFDEPPYIDETTNLVATTTIAELKQLFIGSPVQITSDIIIAGIVVADDRSGNYFKSIIIQDATAGIDIQIDKVALHDDYPIGREVFIKVKDLWLASNNGSIQLGAAIDGSNRAQRIPDNLRSKFLFRGKKDQPIVPLNIRINELNASHIHRLVQIDDVQFLSSDVGKTLANAIAQTSVNLNLEDCNSNSILLRTSGFASFAAVQAPSGKGSITAIYSVFGNDKQLFIRDTSDLKLTGTRCGGGGGDLTLVTIASVRALFQGQTTTAPQKTKIRGSIISDLVNSNITARNVVIQEPNGAGIVIRFTANNTLALGDQVEVDISEMEISEFNGLLQLNNVPNSNAIKIGEGNTPQPVVITLSDLLANFELYESRLVTVNNVTITKGSGNTYSGTCTINDGTASMDLFTQTYAVFSGVEFPVEKVTITAIVSQGGTQQSKQLSVRNLTDIVGGGSGGGEFLETFNGVTNNVDLNLAGWTNIAEIGSRLWRGQIFSGNGYAQATSFNSSDPTNVMWLVSPNIILNQEKLLSFETAMNFWRHDALEVFAATDFNGTNVTTANWVRLDGYIVKESDPVNTFISSGDIDLSGFSGSVRIAFKYSGDNTNNTTTYRVDNVRIRNK
jgi:hypothetical protein